MNKHSLQLRGTRIFLSTMLLLLFVVMTVDRAWGITYNYPQVPLLSLCGADDGYNTDWYPDGRIWLPVNQNNGAPREFLMPVFIDNKWWHYKSTDLAKILVPDPIYSFKFKILYDGVAVTPVDIVTVHPFPTDDSRALNVKGDYTPPLAKDFNITWAVHNDLSYQRYYLEPGDPDIPLSIRQKGKAIYITGTSTKPLPNTDTSNVDFCVLLYVKFRINLERGNITADERISEYTPMYISPDTIMYNDWNVRTDIAFKNLLYNGQVNIQDKYTDPKAPDTYVGLAGMNNKTVPSLWTTEPVLPGTVYLKLTEKLPRIWYDMSRAGSQPPMWDNVNNPNVAPEGSWILRDPLTVDSGKTQQQYQTGQVQFTLLNSTSETRLIDMYVESSAPWLTFALNSANRGKYVQIDPTQAYVYYLDNAILGEGPNKPDPLGNPTNPDAVLTMTINCDPDLITPQQGEKAGIYTGYITFRSATAEISPVRMQVTFINFRNPFEPDDATNTGKPHKGITLLIKNSNGVSGDVTSVVFGTAPRATRNADALLGEYAYQTALSGFGARFYYPDQQWANQNGIPFGYGDMLPSTEHPYSESRDIRDINDSTFSHIYLCRFDAGGAQNYPIVIEWDTTDFPENAQLFLSDTLNGSIFPSINMRQGTHLYGDTMSYTIEDPKITSFKIEYTQPRVVDYVDASGNPMIKKGWNLLSLPVRPKNLSWNVIYPNAMGVPLGFYQSSYNGAPILQPGVGYFVKYSDLVDTQFKGVPMTTITKDPTDDGYSDVIKLYSGWNLIGSLSYPLSINDITFDNFGSEQPPSIAYVKSFGLYGYRTGEGYYPASNLEPGLGYWMKSDHTGYLNLQYKGVIGKEVYTNSDKDNIMNNSIKVVVKDNAQHASQLYITGNTNVRANNFELPPLPPNDLYDARFMGNTQLAVYNTENPPVIQLQGINYPVVLSLNGADANYTFVDAVSGKVLGKINKGETKDLVINSTSYNAIKVLKEDVSGNLALTNNPNPVMTNSSIEYNLPEAANVSLKLYDALGNAVTLDEGLRSAGQHFITLNASNMASGRYICKLTSGSGSVSLMISIVK